jgi:hypothetical protein
MANRKSKSPIEVCWHIVAMTEWDEEYLHDKSPAFIGLNRDHSAETHPAWIDTEIPF